MAWYDGHTWRPYVSAGERRLKAKRAAEKLRRHGVQALPVHVEGRAIAHTFWGKAWCENLESYSDFANRLPRGRTYLRGGAVWHLEVGRGAVEARVQGSECYTVRIAIKPLSRAAWKGVKERCSGRIASMIDLLGGRLSQGVMSVVTDREGGMFPKPREIEMSCSCPDWAGMCKHVAAVMYGVGARLDESPELLFLLRGVDHQELISAKVEEAVQAVVRGGGRRRIASKDVAEVFGVEIESGPKPRPAGSRPARTARIRRPAHAAPPAMPDPVTGKDVAALRKWLQCTKSDLARLLGVSAAAVGVWERSRSALKLQGRSAAALLAAWGLDAAGARDLLARGRTVSREATT